MAGTQIPGAPEATLEDFLYNRFGDKLYRTFFKTYTEKVWGVPTTALWAHKIGITRAKSASRCSKFSPP